MGFWGFGVIVEVIGEFTTNYQPNQTRNINIQRIAELTQGAVIEPGGEFSINDYVGRRTRENGFVDAGVISNGVFTTSVGGGVAKRGVASTIARARAAVVARPRAADRGRRLGARAGGRVDSRARRRDCARSRACALGPRTNVDQTGVTQRRADSLVATSAPDGVNSRRSEANDDEPQGSSKAPARA